jgi:CHAD domain-containing protein
MAKAAKATYDLPDDISFRDAARSVLLAAFQKMMENAPGTRAGLERQEATEEDIEFLHDMRVGSRRLRAGLDVFGKIFPADAFRTLKKEAGDITDALGLVRDLDVQLDTLRRLRDSLPENEAYGIGRLIARQTKRRDKERKALIAAFDRMDKEKFARNFRKALDRAAPAPAEAIGTVADNPHEGRDDG